MSKTIKTFVVLCFAECLVGVAEIALAIAYLCGVNMVEPVTPQNQVLLMVAVYAIFVSLLLVIAINTYKNGNGTNKMLVLTAIVIGLILASYLLLQIISGLISRSSDSYFLLSLTWNIPRLLIDISLVISGLRYFKSP
jgi:hypothetical protein